LRPRERRRRIVHVHEGEFMDNEPILDYEKLEVYQLSLQFVAASARILAQFPSGYSPYAGQLRRAALSIPLNIAEAVGKTQMPDRKRFSRPRATRPWNAARFSTSSASWI
jgi:hypothetical protein